MFPTDTVLRGLELLQKDAQEEAAEARAELNRDLDKLHDLLNRSYRMYAAWLRWAADQAEAGHPQSDGLNFPDETPASILMDRAEIAQALPETMWSVPRGPKLYQVILRMIAEKQEELKRQAPDYRPVTAILMAYENPKLSMSAAQKLGLNGKLLAQAVRRAAE